MTGRHFPWEFDPEVGPPYTLLVRSSNAPGAEPLFEMVLQTSQELMAIGASLRDLGQQLYELGEFRDMTESG